MVQSINSFTSFDGKTYSSDKYDIKNTSGTTEVYEKSSGKIIYSQYSGGVSESASTYIYDEKGNLFCKKNDWYECGYEYTQNPEEWFSDSNQLYRTTYYYDENGKTTMSLRDELGDGVVESITHYNYNDNGSYETWTDSNMNDKFDEDESKNYYNDNGGYLSQEEYEKMNNIKKAPDLDGVAEQKAGLFDKIKDFLANLFK